MLQCVHSKTTVFSFWDECFSGLEICIFVILGVKNMSYTMCKNYFLLVWVSAERMILWSYLILQQEQRRNQGVNSRVLLVSKRNIQIQTTALNSFTLLWLNTFCLAAYFSMNSAVEVDGFAVAIIIKAFYELMCPWCMLPWVLLEAKGTAFGPELLFKASLSNLWLTWGKKENTLKLMFKWN